MRSLYSPKESSSSTRKRGLKTSPRDALNAEEPEKQPGGITAAVMAIQTEAAAGISAEDGNSRFKESQKLSLFIFAQYRSILIKISSLNNAGYVI
jgi:hypothetical protein